MCSRTKAFPATRERTAGADAQSFERSATSGAIPSIDDHETGGPVLLRRASVTAIILNFEPEGADRDSVIGPWEEDAVVSLNFLLMSRVYRYPVYTICRCGTLPNL